MQYRALVPPGGHLLKQHGLVMLLSLTILITRDIITGRCVISLTVDLDTHLALCQDQ